MLFCMRTTLHLPGDLYREVKSTSALEGRTVTSFVEEALRLALAQRAARTHDAPPPYRVTVSGAGGTRPGIDLDSSAALLDVLEGR
jgi:hypothetical protein